MLGSILVALTAARRFGSDVRVAKARLRNPPRPEEKRMVTVTET